MVRGEEAEGASGLVAGGGVVGEEDVEVGLRGEGGRELSEEAGKEGGGLGEEVVWHA